MMVSPNRSKTNLMLACWGFLSASNLRTGYHLPRMKRVMSGIRKITLMGIWMNSALGETMGFHCIVDVKLNFKRNVANSMSYVRNFLFLFLLLFRLLFFTLFLALALALACTRTLTLACTF